MHKGIAASEGIAMGKVLLLEKYRPSIRRFTIAAHEIEEEKNKFLQALALSKAQIEEIQSFSNKVSSSILESQIMMLEDPELIATVLMRIEKERQDAASSVEESISFFTCMLEDSEDDYIKERAIDLKDLSYRLVMNIFGKDIPSLLNLREDVVVVAKDITPSDTAQMDRERVLGFLTDMGGKTSHAAIMARTLGIPAILGMENISKKLNTGDFICFDGEDGEVFVNPSEDIIEKYRQKKLLLDQERELLYAYKDQEAVTLDGHRVELAANIGSPQDAFSALSFGVKGVGLYRTEFLYMDRPNLPSEDEQFEAYKAVLEVMKDGAVIRTLDIGGDKNLPYLSFAQEMNPFLGYRAIRIGLDQPHLFKTQLRALLRASVYGNLKIMYPMISCAEEVREANALLDECRAELDAEGLPYSDQIQVGVMIEIPSAAICADLIAPEVDFFSIGTNDLTQYTCAVDRMNSKVSKLYNPFNPAVLRLIKHVIDVSHQHGLWCGMCGETAGYKSFIPLYLGMGLDEFSMNARTTLKAKKLLENLSFKEMKEMADEALTMRYAEDIERFVAERAGL